MLAAQSLALSRSWEAPNKCYFSSPHDSPPFFLFTKPCSHQLPRNDASKVSHSSSQELTELAEPRSSEPAKTTWRNLSLLGHITIALKISRTIYQTRTSLTTSTNYQFAFPKGRYRRSKICMRSMFSSSPHPTSTPGGLCLLLAEQELTLGKELGWWAVPLLIAISPFFLANRLTPWRQSLPSRQPQASGEASCISKLRGVFRGVFVFALVPFSLWFRNKQMTQFWSMRQEGKSTWGTWKRFSQFQSTHKKIQFCAVPDPCVSLWCLALLQPFRNHEESHKW